MLRPKPTYEVWRIRAMAAWGSPINQQQMSLPWHPAGPIFLCENPPFPAPSVFCHPPGSPGGCIAFTSTLKLLIFSYLAAVDPRVCRPKKLRNATLSPPLEVAFYKARKIFDVKSTNCGQGRREQS